MNEPTVEMKHGKRDLSVIDIEKTLDRLADAKATITALEAEIAELAGKLEKSESWVEIRDKQLNEALRQLEVWEDFDG